MGGDESYTTKKCMLYFVNKKIVHGGKFAELSTFTKFPRLLPKFSMVLLVRMLHN